MEEVLTWTPGFRLVRNGGSGGGVGQVSPGAGGTGNTPPVNPALKERWRTNRSWRWWWSDRRAAPGSGGGAGGAGATAKPLMGHQLLEQEVEEVSFWWSDHQELRYKFQ